MGGWGFFRVEGVGASRVARVLECRILEFRVYRVLGFGGFWV